MIVKEFTDRNEFMKSVVDKILELCGGLENASYVALAGGSLKSVYEELNNKISDRNIEFFQTDERYIGNKDENSNFKMITESLTRSAGKKFHYFDTSLGITSSLSKYKQELLDRNHEFDLTVLGIGTDGHIASLFPDSNALENNDMVVHTVTDKFVVQDRLTLSYPVIMSSKSIVVVLNGKDKKEILDELLHGDKNEKEFPAKKLLVHNNLFIYFYPSSSR